MSVINDVLNLVYPRRCAACNTVMGGEKYLCEDCEDKIIYNAKPCIKCGGTKKSCRCSLSIFRFAGCICPIVNDEENTAMRCVYNYKLSGNGEVAGFFAALMITAIKKNYRDIKFDAVTSVPMTYSKSEQKGYDHSKILAIKISELLNVPYEEMLVKTASHSQHDLKAAERFKKISGVFAAKGRCNYNNVLLVDDIITTGATLNECSKELMFAGVKNVYCSAAVTVALARNKTKVYNENGEEK